MPAKHKERVMQGKSRQAEESNSGIFFFLLLIVAIFVLYCLSMTRPYC